MKLSHQMSRTAILVESALMVGLAFTLSIIPFIRLPWGGSITLLSTLPIVIVSLRHPLRWGLATAALFSFTQLLQGLDKVVAVPANTLLTMVLCALLDYLLAYSVLGFTGSIARRFKSAGKGVILGVAITGLLRYVCSVLSGVLLWGQWAWNGWPLWPYSFVYNAAWCLPDVFIVLLACVLLQKFKILDIVFTKSSS